MILVPSISDYRNAVRALRKHSAGKLRDLDPLLTSRGELWTEAGNQGVVFKCRNANGQLQAIKCWTRNLETVANRYQAIEKELVRANLRHTPALCLQEDGLLMMDGSRRPYLWMEWIESLDLRTYVIKTSECADFASINRLRHSFVDMITANVRGGIAHGDLHAENIRITPEGNLRLIDFDGVVGPSIIDEVDMCFGQEGFQHPLRLSGKYPRAFAECDHFSEIVIYLSLLAISRDYPRLKPFLESTDGLVFRQSDFEAPHDSDVFKLLIGSGGWIAEVAGMLKTYCASNDLKAIPSLIDVCAMNKDEIAAPDPQSSRFFSGWHFDGPPTTLHDATASKAQVLEVRARHTLTYVPVFVESISVRVGDAVQAGQCIMLLQAKPWVQYSRSTFPVVASSAGVISGINVKVGDTVSNGTLLAIVATACSHEEDDARQIGVVKSFDESRGFGYIQRVSGDDLFVRAGDVLGFALKPLKKGQTVSFFVRSIALQTHEIAFQVKVLSD